MKQLVYLAPKGYRIINLLVAVGLSSILLSDLNFSFPHILKDFVFIVPIYLVSTSSLKVMYIENQNFIVHLWMAPFIRWSYSFEDVSHIELRTATTTYRGYPSFRVHSRTKGEIKFFIPRPHSDKIWDNAESVLKDNRFKVLRK